MISTALTTLATGDNTESEKWMMVISRFASDAFAYVSTRR
jgi:hypothetical protein